MSYVLWTLACLIGYTAGLIILVKVTPLLLSRSYDEGLFMAMAARDVFGALFAFGAVALTFALFSGSLGIRILDFFLLVGIIIASARLSYRSFYSRGAKANKASRIIAGTYCFLLALAAFYYLVLLFTPIR